MSVDEAVHRRLIERSVRPSRAAVALSRRGRTKKASFGCVLAM